MFSFITKALKARKERKISIKIAKIEEKRLAQIKADEEEKQIEAQRIAREAKIPRVNIPKELAQRTMNAFIKVASCVPDNDEGDYLHKKYMRDANLIKQSIHSNTGFRIDVVKRAADIFSDLAYSVSDNDEGDHWHKAYLKDARTLRAIIAQ
jgi:hypothetical protein